MKIAFFSNFLNHHQLPMCEAFCARSDVDFVFVACEKISDDRINMGYQDMNCTYDFVVRAYEDEAKAMRIAIEFDIVIFGASPTKYLTARMTQKKLSFRFCERSLKKGTWRRFIPRTARKIKEGYTAYKNDPLFVLASSAFASSDLALCGFDTNKCFKWGYFPEVGQKKEAELLESKKDGETINIFYAGRLLKLKRVIDTVKAVELLVKSGTENISFSIMGDGEEKKNIEEYVKKHKLEKYIKFLPFMPSDKVREYMDRADVFVMGSNFNEGWGAVVNEAMSSCCVPVVSHSVGSAAYLVSHGKNGFVYPLGNVKMLAKYLKILLEDDSTRATIASSAYKTVTEIWCAPVAVERFVKFCKNYLHSGNIGSLHDVGPMSPARALKNNWIKRKF